MHRHKILLIEDEAELASLLGELLSDLDAEVRVAADLAEAENHLATFHPCVVVTDLTLPDVDRDDLIPRLRARVGGTPIVLMSAIAASELHRFAQEQGAQGSVAKPFELEEFEQSVVFRCGEELAAQAP